MCLLCSIACGLFRSASVPPVRQIRSKTAATLGSVIFFAAFFPYYYVGGEAQTEVSTKTWASLLGPTCLALGSDTFAAFEGGASETCFVVFAVWVASGTGSLWIRKESRWLYRWFDIDGTIESGVLRGLGGRSVCYLLVEYSS